MEIKMLLLNRHVRLLALKSKAKPALTIQVKKGEPDTYEGGMRNHFILVCLLTVRLSWFLMTEKIGDHILMTH